MEMAFLEMPVSAIVTQTSSKTRNARAPTANAHQGAPASTPCRCRCCSSQCAGPCGPSSCRHRRPWRSLPTSLSCSGTQEVSSEQQLNCWFEVCDKSIKFHTFKHIIYSRSLCHLILCGFRSD
jgi:hypothetical protein